MSVKTPHRTRCPCQPPSRMPDRADECQFGPRRSVCIHVGWTSERAASEMTAPIRRGRILEAVRRMQAWGGVARSALGVKQLLDPAQVGCACLRVKQRGELRKDHVPIKRSPLPDDDAGYFCPVRSTPGEHL